jgi:hypothetical protein
VRTLQIKCDLLKKQNEQQKQLHLEAREEEDERRAREREEDDGLNKVSETALISSLLFSVSVQYCAVTCFTSVYSVYHHFVPKLPL